MLRILFKNTVLRAVLLLATSPLAWSGPSDFVKTPFGIQLLRSTEAGEALCTHWLGHAARGEADLREVWRRVARLEAGAPDSPLLAGLVRIESELAPLRFVERARLAELARAHLVIPAENYELARDAFRASGREAGHARLIEGAQALARRHPARVAVVAQGGKNFLLISTGDARLLPEVSALLDEAGVSFPLAEKGGHLYVRARGAIWDFYEGLTRAEYRFSGRAQLEPVVLLSAAERGRLHAYVRAASRDPGRVLGRFDYDGVRGHNCTSWICAGPLGDERESLLRLAGASLDDEVHTNPGAWVKFLVESAETSRVPLVVYWTPAPLAEARAAFARGEALAHWDYAIR